MLFAQARNLFGSERGGRVIQVGDKVGPTGASVTGKQLAGPVSAMKEIVLLSGVFLIAHDADAGYDIEGDYHARLGVVRDAALAKSITKLERFHHLLLSLVANRGRRDGFRALEVCQHAQDTSNSPSLSHFALGSAPPLRAIQSIDQHVIDESKANDPSNTHNLASQHPSHLDNGTFNTRARAPTPNLSMSVPNPATRPDTLSDEPPNTPPTSSTATSTSQSSPPSNTHPAHLSMRNQHQKANPSVTLSDESGKRRQLRPAYSPWFTDPPIVSTRRSTIDRATPTQPRLLPSLYQPTHRPARTIELTTLRTSPLDGQAGSDETSLPKGSANAMQTDDDHALVPPYVALCPVS
ncbi:hypothetical protein EYR36_011940 [Pleurotus pulmonarius]|nr:hypothetical protein EYR36_011937 [Pleurotus pulmonarius]KAF4566509.1 hypothetical protein EYR36_011940 [Pleurotus pulmonarius]